MSRRSGCRFPRPRPWWWGRGAFALSWPDAARPMFRAVRMLHAGPTSNVWRTGARSPSAAEATDALLAALPASAGEAVPLASLRQRLAGVLGGQAPAGCRRPAVAGQFEVSVTGSPAAKTSGNELDGGRRRATLRHRRCNARARRHAHRDRLRGIRRRRVAAGVLGPRRDGHRSGSSSDSASPFANSNSYYAATIDLSGAAACAVGGAAACSNPSNLIWAVDEGVRQRAGSGGGARAATPTRTRGTRSAPPLSTPGTRAKLFSLSNRRRRRSASPVWRLRQQLHRMFPRAAFFSRCGDAFFLQLPVQGAHRGLSCAATSSGGVGGGGVAANNGRRHAPAGGRGGTAAR